MTRDSGHSVSPSFLLVGRIIRPHGVRGAVVVESISDCPFRFDKGSRVLLDYKGILRKTLTVVSSMPFKGKVLVKFAEIQTREDADDVRECALVIPYSDADTLKNGEYWVHELVGMSVESESGERLGEVSDVVLGTHQDHLVVRDNEGQEFRVPFVRAFVMEVNRETGVVRIRLVEGLRPKRNRRRRENH